MTHGEGNIITSPQTITDSWTDLGLQIQTIDYSFFSTYLDIDINDSKNVQFRFRGIYDTGGADFIIPLKTIKKDKVLLDDVYYEVNSDADQKIILQTDMDQNIKFIKLQVKVGTVGATAGIINTAKYRQGYRQ